MVISLGAGRAITGGLGGWIRDATLIKKQCSKCDTLEGMLSGDPLGAIFRSLPRPILFGLLTGIGLAYFGNIATPQLTALIDEGHGPIVTGIAKNLRVGIALMPTPAGFLVYAIFQVIDAVAASRPQER